MVRWEEESKDYISKQEPVSEEPAKLQEQYLALQDFKGAVDGRFTGLWGTPGGVQGQSPWGV